MSRPVPPHPLAPHPMAPHRMTAAALAAAVAVAAGGAGPLPMVASAAAQTVETPRSVRATPAPNSERRGTNLGAYVAYLSVGVRGTYNDNLFAQAEDTTSDYVARVRPRAELASRWRRHQVRAIAEMDAARHLETTSEDVIDFGGSLRGRLDVGATGELAGELSASREHESRTSPNDPNGEARTPIDRYGALIEAEQPLGRLGLAFAGSYELLDFADVEAAGDGPDINNDDRDRSIATVAGRASYGLSATVVPFVQAAYDVTDYRQDTDDSGFDRDATGYELSGGARYRANGFTTVEGRLGYRQQTLDDDRLDDVEGLTAELTLLSNLTPATTLEVEGSRVVQQSTAASSAAFFATNAVARLDHAFRRNVIVGADAAFARHTFTGIAREDLIFGFGLDARYDPSAFLRLSLDYDFTRRASNVEAEFERNRFTVGAELRY